jgi:hypothetical protein
VYIEQQRFWIDASRTSWKMPTSMMQGCPSQMTRMRTIYSCLSDDVYAMLDGRCVLRYCCIGHSVANSGCGGKGCARAKDTPAVSSSAV